jgi:hypothetical protein
MNDQASVPIELRIARVEIARLGERRPSRSEGASDAQDALDGRDPFLRRILDSAVLDVRVDLLEEARTDSDVGPPPRVLPSPPLEGPAQIEKEVRRREITVVIGHAGQTRSIDLVSTVDPLELEAEIRPLPADARSSEPTRLEARASRLPVEPKTIVGQNADADHQLGVEPLPERLGGRCYRIDGRLLRNPVGVCRSRGQAPQDPGQSKAGHDGLRIHG